MSSEAISPNHSPLQSPPAAGPTNGLQAESLASGVVFLVALTAAQKFIGFGRSLAFCRWLEPAELGRWELAFSFLLLAAPLAVCGIPGVFGRYLEHYRQRGLLRRFLACTTIATTGLSVTAILLMLAARRPLAWFMFEDVQLTQLVTLVCTSLLAVVGFNFVIVLLESLRQPRFVTLIRFCHSLLFMAAGVGLLWWRPAGARSIIVAYAAACLAVCIPACWRLLRLLRASGVDTRPLGQRELWSKLLPAAGAIWSVNLLTNLFELADRWMIVHFSPLGPEQAAALVGQYHSSRAIPLLLVGLTFSFNGIFLPYLSHDWEANRRRHVRRRLNLATKLVAVLMTAAGALILLAAPPLFDWLLAGKYQAGLSVLPWTLVYCIWCGLLLVVQNYLWCVERARFVGVALLLGLSANGVLNYFLMPRWGLTGAVVATAAANLLALSLILVFSRAMGMRFDRSALAAVLLPLVLVLGPALALAVLAALALMIARRRWLLTPDDRQRLVQAAFSLTHRLARALPRPTTLGDIAK